MRPQHAGDLDEIASQFEHRARLVGRHDAARANTTTQFQRDLRIARTQVQYIARLGKDRQQIVHKLTLTAR